VVWYNIGEFNSLINPNQIRLAGYDVNDDPFTARDRFGIDCPEQQVFIPFDTTGTVCGFSSCMPTRWEQLHLPVITLFPEQWDPTVDLQSNQFISREENEM
jgi:hypothetical protein